MIDLNALASRLEGGPLSLWPEMLAVACERALQPSRHGDMPRWLQALGVLPDLDASSVALDQAVVRAGDASDTDIGGRRVLENALRELRPWRKGPFDLFGVFIDTEWRSDLKWDRVCPALEPLDGRTVLDVGCGSGYHCWRMAGAGASTVIGIEPMPLYVVQFAAVRKYLGDRGVFVLPLRLEDMPQGSRAFDTVFSMGVLYHRRSPLDHLADLRGALTSGGQLLLETLVVDGGDDVVLMPPGRYARMRNVWFLPSVGMLRIWLSRIGFRDIRVVDVTATTAVEQRRTEWMPFESLAESLDPEEPAHTLEGHPAPLRAFVTAYAP